MTTIAPPVLTLAQRVATHMETRHPETTEAAAWIVATDHRDGSAVVVWRRGDDPTMPASARGIPMWRWLHGLRAAGFTAEARLDMEVFGRPDEDSPDGRAQWLHVTAWAEPAPAWRDPRTPAEIRRAAMLRLECTC